MAKQILKPTGNRILVRPDATAEKVGSIYIPNAAKNPSQEGVAVACGPKCEHVATGDRVLFGKFGGTEIGVNGEDLKLVNEDDVLAVLS